MKNEKFLKMRQLIKRIENETHEKRKKFLRLFCTFPTPYKTLMKIHYNWLFTISYIHQHVYKHTPKK